MRLGTTALALTLAASFGFAAQAQTQITGAGSTFVYPVLSKWSADYSKTTHVQVNYQSIGSGGGIAQIKAGTVDFGATDTPLTPDGPVGRRARAVSGDHRRHHPGAQRARHRRRAS